MKNADQLRVSSSGSRLSLDAHGGDHGLDVTVPGALDALRADPLLEIVLVGQGEAIESALSGRSNGLDSRLSVVDAPDVLAADAKPTAVLRRGRKSSLWLAMDQVAKGEADACVSGGSTAALMTAGVTLIGLLPGIARPALMAYVPNPLGHVAMLDLGANLDVDADQLVQFAIMGAVTLEVADRIEKPRVALLNVGHEDSKGHTTVRAAHDKLKQLPINYVGFIEGNDLFSDKADVAVCDGFAGNLVLKSSEGLARMLTGEFRKALEASMISRLGAMLAGRSIRRTLAPLDPSAHNGAPLLGLKAVVMKSHGSANQKAMTRAILEAGREARRRVPEKIEASIRAFQTEFEA